MSCLRATTGHNWTLFWCDLLTYCDATYYYCRLESVRAAGQIPVAASRSGCSQMYDPKGATAGLNRVIQCNEYAAFSLCMPLFYLDIFLFQCSCGHPKAHFPEFPEMEHLFPDINLNMKSCRGGLVRFLFCKPLHYCLICLLGIDVLLVMTGRNLHKGKWRVSRCTTDFAWFCHLFVTLLTGPFFTFHFIGCQLSIPVDSRLAVEDRNRIFGRDCHCTMPWIGHPTWPAWRVCWNTVAGPVPSYGGIDWYGPYRLNMKNMW